MGHCNKTMGHCNKTMGHCNKTMGHCLIQLSHSSLLTPHSSVLKVLGQEYSFYTTDSFLLNQKFNNGQQCLQFQIQISSNDLFFFAEICMSFYARQKTFCQNQIFNTRK
jgi:hypothetical protein